MRNAVKMGFMNRLSGRRVFTELFLILQEENPIYALRRMKDFNLFQFFHPHLRFDEEKINIFEQIHHVISWFDLLFLEEKYDRWLVYFYGLIDSLKEEEVKEICERLDMAGRVKKRVMDGKREAEETLLKIFFWIETGIEPKRSEIYELLDPIPTEVKLFMTAKTTQNLTRKYISLYFTQLKDIKPILRGADLIKMGIKPGPEIKKRLNDLLKARLDEGVITRQDEMDYISKAHGIE